VALAQRASDDHAALALFPELGLSGYSSEDLFHQEVLLDATRKAAAYVVEADMPKGGLFIARVGIAGTFKRIPVPQERGRQPTLLPSRPCYL
jgi:hypothetical protein